MVNVSARRRQLDVMHQEVWVVWTSCVMQSYILLLSCDDLRATLDTLVLLCSVAMQSWNALCCVGLGWRTATWLTMRFIVPSYALRYQLPRLFTQWDEAIHIAADVTRIVCLCLVVDGMQIICSGVLRGVGTLRGTLWCA